jgi:hypothetical protein
MTDSELVATALARVAELSDERAGGALGVSEGSVRRWRAELRDGQTVQVRAPQRLQLERYLAGGVEESADYWRGVLATHRNTLRAIVSTMDEQLASAGAAGDARSKATPLADSPEVLKKRARSIAAVEAVRRAEAATPHQPAAAPPGSRRRPKAG